MNEILSGRVLQLANLLVSDPPSDIVPSFLSQLHDAVYSQVIPSSLAEALRNGVVPREPVACRREVLPL